MTNAHALQQLTAIVVWQRHHGRTFAAWLRFWRIDARQLTPERRATLHDEYTRARARIARKRRQLAAIAA